MSQPPLKEQIAVHSIPQRASRPPTLAMQDQRATAAHQAEHSAGVRPEDQPHQTRQPPPKPRPQLAPTYDTADDDVFAESRRPSSTRRYPTTNAPVVRQARLQVRAFVLMAIGVILLGVVFALTIVWFISPALQNWQDTSTYGYPRTTHARAITGHGDKAHPYSDYIGINIKCSLYVVELGEGDPIKQRPQLYFVSRFVGSNCDLTAITSITFADENGDGKVDMLIVANKTLYVFYNNGTSFTQSLK